MSNLKNRIINLKKPEEQNKQSNMDQIIKNAKDNAKKETESFTKACNIFIDEIEKLALYSPISLMLKPLFESSKESITNVINGKNRCNMNQSEFLDCRQEYFKMLIKRYEKEK